MIQYTHLYFLFAITLEVYVLTGFYKLASLANRPLSELV